MLRLLPRKPVKIDLTEMGMGDPMSLNRRRVMEQITALNASATADFLEQFDDEALSRYLEHLEMSNQPAEGIPAGYVPTESRGPLPPPRAPERQLAYTDY